jgi:hypothetical protein
MTAAIRSRETARAGRRAAVTGGSVQARPDRALDLDVGQERRPLNR